MVIKSNKEYEGSVSKRRKRDESLGDVLKDREDEIFNISRERVYTGKQKPDKKITTKKCKLRDI